MRKTALLMKTYCTTCPLIGMQNSLNLPASHKSACLTTSLNMNHAHGAEKGVLAKQAVREAVGSWVSWVCLQSELCSYNALAPGGVWNIANDTHTQGSTSLTRQSNKSSGRQVSHASLLQDLEVRQAAQDKSQHYDLGAKLPIIQYILCCQAYAPNCFLCVSSCKNTASLLFRA